MLGYRKSHNIEEIKRKLTIIIRKLKDPRISDNMISIVKVDVSKDISNTKVYVSSLRGIEDAKEIVKVLKNAEGYIRHEMGRSMNLRYIPTVSFCATDSIEYGVNISKTLENLKKRC